MTRCVGVVRYPDFTRKGKVMKKVIVMALLCAAPVFSQSDPAFNVSTKNEKVNNRRGEYQYKEGDSVVFPNGAILYPNMNNLRRYEGLDATMDQRKRRRQILLDGGEGGDIHAICTYTDNRGEVQKAYRILINYPDRTLALPRAGKSRGYYLEGWYPGKLASCQMKLAPDSVKRGR